MKKNKDLKKLITIVLIGLVIRALFAFSFEATGDFGTWRLGGRTGVERTQLGMGDGTVYDGDCPTICSNWPPLTFHYMTMMRWSYLHLNPLNLPEPGFYKLLPFLADTGTIVMIYFLAIKLKNKKPLLLATIYSLHPIAIYVGGYHGQRDTIWVFFTLLCIYLLKQKNIGLAAVLYAFGASIKIPALFLFPFFLIKIPKLHSKILFGFLTSFFFLFLNSPEIVVYFETVFKQVFLYGGWSGWWGISGLVTKVGLLTNDPTLSTDFAAVQKIMLYLSVVSANIYFGLKAKNYLTGVLGIILTVSVFAAPFASQYLVWILPFLLLMPSTYNKLKKYFSIFGTFMEMSFMGIFGIKILEFIFLKIPTKYFFYKQSFFTYPMDTSLPVWIILVLLLYKVLNDKKLYTTKKA